MKSELVKTRLGSELKEYSKALARKNGMNLSEWMRYHLYQQYMLLKDTFTDHEIEQVEMRIKNTNEETLIQKCDKSLQEKRRLKSEALAAFNKEWAERNSGSEK